MFEKPKGSDGNRFNEIWKNEKTNDFIIAMDDWLCEKCDYGEKVEVLSDAEKVFYFNQSLEEEVNNGGFSQFFFNSSSNFCYEILNSLREVGAVKTAGILKKALDAFGCEIPLDLYERREMLETV